MENNNNKNVLLFVGLLAVLAVTFFVFKYYKNQVVGNSEQIAPKITVDTNNNTPPPYKDKAKVLSYNEALALYKDKSLQLGADCQATPNVLNFRNRTLIMVDNRSDKVRTIKVGKVVTIKPWGFTFVQLSSSKLPITWLVDCDSLQNVASINIQK